MTAVTENPDVGRCASNFRADDARPGSMRPVAWRREMEERLEGATCGGGFDIGQTADLTALSLVFDAEREFGVAGKVVLPWMWCPADNIALRSRRDRAPYVESLRDGFLRSTPGDFTDYGRIRDEALEIFGRFDVGEVAGDPLFQGAQLFSELVDAGVNMTDFPQRITEYAEPMREFEELVIGECLFHGAHPLLRWCATNVVVWVDVNETKRPDKKRSTERIDPIVATVMGIAAEKRVGAGNGVGIFV